jgi:hypothetical protein
VRRLTMSWSAFYLLLIWRKLRMRDYAILMKLAAEGKV